MSNFSDEATVKFTGGKGGNGMIAFRKEKFIPRGGPNGGDGGNGASIILIADNNINTLSDFNKSKEFRAENGQNGGKQNKFGRNGEDLILKTPVGTLIIDAESNELLCDLKENDQQFIVAKGGKGGLGNAKFKSSIHQVPRFAEDGEEGAVIKVKLELQLVADVGIIGFPSSGKSTLISRISEAKPKIAEYPFTTLIPHLGVVVMRIFDKKMDGSFVAADIPGLIEGAHRGKGLGVKFLKHISRTEILVHLIDLTRGDLNDYKAINNELEKFDKRLSKKKQIVALSKKDAVQKDYIDQFKKELSAKYPELKGNIHVFSSISGEGLSELVFAMYKEVGAIRKQIREKTSHEAKLKPDREKVFRPHLNKKKFDVVRKKDFYEVSGDRIEQVVNMTNIENPEGLERIYHFLGKMGIKSELRKQGAQPGDKIKISGKIIKMRE